MIKIHTKDTVNEKVLKKVCKKLKMDEAGVTFAAYEKFMFSYLFALAIKDKKLYIFGTDENNKSNKLSVFEGSEIDTISVDKKTDFNLHLTNGKFINLTTLVPLTPNGKMILKTFKSYITSIK